MRKFIFLFILFLVFINPVAKAQWSISADAGYSYRIFIPNGIDTGSYAAYIEKKRHGTNMNAEVIRFNEDDGIGFSFSDFFNKVNSSNIAYNSSNKMKVSDNISIQYYSIQYHRRKHYNNPHITGEFVGGFGYVRYQDSNQQDTAHNNNIGHTYGFNISLLLEYSIYKHFSIFAATKLLFATLKEMETNGQTIPLTQIENLSHFDLNAGVRLNF